MANASTCKLCTNARVQSCLRLFWKDACSAGPTEDGCVHACRLGCGPINELRLLALEDAERHGKLEALYHKCGFRTTGPARFECDTDHTYRHVPMAKVLEPLVFVCVPRSLAHGQPHEQQGPGLCHAAHAVSVAERSTHEGSRSTYPGQDSCICSDTPSEPFA